ncbi:MAG: hypothetical protein U0169_22310 [Polyangiaceae bacterium]
MQRAIPRATSDEIDLYIQTYTSLLRSSGEVRVRAFEEAHAFSKSSLHEGALSSRPDISAFAYAAGRLPDEMPEVRLVVLGQSHEVFEAAGFPVRTWRGLRTRGRRRPLRYDDAGTLAVFIASESDIDDLVPILTAWQIEWNKMHAALRGIASTLAASHGVGPELPSREVLAQLLGFDVSDVAKLEEALRPAHFDARIRSIAAAPADVRVRMLAPSYSQYQRAAQRWWSGVEPTYLGPPPKRRRPVYFVSSNTHSIANVLGGFALSHQDALVDYARRKNPEGLADTLDAALASNDRHALCSLLYYVMRGYLHESPGEARIQTARAFEAESGVIHLAEPGHLEIDAQLIELSKLKPERLDPRLDVRGLDALAKSDAVLVNIDYPLGRSAYHLLSRIGQGVGELRGVYVTGKAATLNGRVGDVLLSDVVHDEHTSNTFLFRNVFGARDVAGYLRHGSVFDNQAALTVRSAFLQNHELMGAVYKNGYTVLEMEAGPFLSAVYELVEPNSVPQNEIVHMTRDLPFDVGFLHYASDTPYSRRQSLLSKSMSYFGVEATYACSLAIVRRILEVEVSRIGGVPVRPSFVPPPPPTTSR